MTDLATQRREKYHADPEYRHAELERQRLVYARKTGKVYSNAAREALIVLDAIPDVVGPSMKLTTKNLSGRLRRSPTYVSRLIAKGLWPAPTQEDGFYSLPQVRRLFTAFADHLDFVSTYRADHAGTKAALFRAMQEPSQ